jgi:hypothetical protein
MQEMTWADMDRLEAERRGVQRARWLDGRSRRGFAPYRIIEGGQAPSLQIGCPRPIANSSHWVGRYSLPDATPSERSEDRDSDAASRAGSNGATGWTGDLVGTSMRTVSMSVVIVPPRFEGLPTALRRRSQ